MSDILVLTPHPDDEAYAFGGVISLATDAGWTCTIECATAGEKGKRHDGGDTAPEHVGRVRLEELAESCAILGAEPPRCWTLPDGRLRDEPSQARRIGDLLAKHNPMLVLTLGADGAYGHPDHIALYRWVVEAWEVLDPAPVLLFAAFPKGLFIPQWEKCLGMMGDPPTPSRGEIGTDTPQLSIRIEEAAQRKLAAIAAHRSQLPGGDPEALFPPGIVAATLREEWFTVGGGTNVQEVLASLFPGN